MEMLAHVGPLSKSSKQLDIEDVKSMSQMPFDMSLFQKNIRHILGALGRDNLTDGQEAQVGDKEGSEWVGEHGDVGEGINEGESVNDMEL